MCNCNQQPSYPVQQNCGKPLAPQPDCNGCIDKLDAECIRYQEPDIPSGLTFLNLPSDASLKEIVEAIDRALHTLNSRI